MKKRTRPGWLRGLWGLVLCLVLAACQGPLAQPTTPGVPTPASPAVSVSPPGETDAPPSQEAEAAADPKGNTESLDENGSYDSTQDVALYIQLYGELPDNFITKDEARDLGWEGGSVEAYAPGKCIGGDSFGNREGLLPKANGRTWTECDIDTLGEDSRGAKRLVFSNDGLIYYTDDHYESFERVYPGE